MRRMGNTRKKRKAEGSTGGEERAINTRGKLEEGQEQGKD